MLGYEPRVPQVSILRPGFAAFPRVPDSYTVYPIRTRVCGRVG